VTQVKYRIIVYSIGSDDWSWATDGWFDVENRPRAKAQSLFAKANKAIDQAKDAKEAVRLLEVAGFEVRLN
jgi:hypothetical protein